MVINNQVFIRRFVIFTFCVTAIHFILESLYTIQFGQSFLGLLPDLIADALLVTGGLQFSDGFETTTTHAVHIGF